MRLKFLATVALASQAAMAAACGGRSDPEPLSRVVADAGAGAKTVAWVGDRLVVQRYDRDVDVGSNWTSRLSVVEVEGRALTELPIEYTGLCGPDGARSFESPVRAGQTTIVFLQRCAALQDGVPSLAHRGRLLLFDVVSGEMVPKFAGSEIHTPLQEVIPDSQNDGIALDLATNRAWMTARARGDLLRLVDLTRGEIIQEPNLPYRQIWGLAASAGSAQVVFAARNDDTGIIGSGKANLYIAPFADLSAATILLEDVVGPLCCGWSFDNRWIAFDGTWGGKRGLHVVEVETGKVILIEEGSFHPSASSWSPTDYRIALVDKTDNDHPGRIRIFDLTSLLGR